MPKIDPAGVRIYYEVHGSGPALLTHGYSSTFEMWKGQIEALSGHAVNIDQPQAFIDAVVPFLDGLSRSTVTERPVRS